MIGGGSSSWSASPVRCWSSLTAFSVCRMLSAAESTWLLRKSGSWRLTAISASVWILPSMRSSSIDTKSAFFFARPKLSSRSSAIAMLSCSERDDPFVAARLRPLEVLAQLREAGRDLGLVHRLQEAIERGLRHQQSQEQPEQAVQARRAHFLAGRGLTGSGAADAGGDGPHLDAAGVQPLEPFAGFHRQTGQHIEQRRRGRGSGSAATTLPDVPSTLTSIALRKRGIETRPVRYASSPAATSGSSTGASGVRAAAAAPPPNNNRFQRNRNASRR